MNPKRLSIHAPLPDGGSWAAIAAAKATDASASGGGNRNAAGRVKLVDEGEVDEVGVMCCPSLDATNVGVSPALPQMRRDTGSEDKRIGSA